MKCKLCDRPETEEGFCDLHFKAYKNVLNNFDSWKAAFNLTWNEYLVKNQKNSLTGEWAKDVSKYLIKDERKDV
jgi:hypothetical protein